MMPSHLFALMILLVISKPSISQQNNHHIFVGIAHSIGATRIIESTESSSSRSTKSLPTNSQSLSAEWFNNSELFSLGCKITRSDMRAKYSVHEITDEDYDTNGWYYYHRTEGYSGAYADQSSRLGISGTLKIGLFRQEIDPLLKLYMGLSFGREFIYKRDIEENYFYHYDSSDGRSVGPAPNYEPYTYKYFNIKDRKSFTEKFNRTTPRSESCLELFIAPRLQMSERICIALEISRKFYFRSVLSDIPNEFITKHNYLTLAVSYRILWNNSEGDS